MTVQSPLYGPSSAFGVVAARRADALTALAIAGDDTTFEYLEDFLLPAGSSNIINWQNANANGGTVVTNTAGTAGGIVEISSSTTANGSAKWYTQANWISNVSTSKWYLAARFKNNTAVDASANMGVGLLNAGTNKTIYMGYCGALDSSHFGLQYDGNIAGTFGGFGVATDTTTYHKFEMWGLGDTKLHARIDGGADIGPLTMSAAPSDAIMVMLLAQNGGTAAKRSILLDYVYMLAQRS